MFGAEIDFRASFEKKVAEQMVRRRSRGDGSDLRSVTPCVHLIIEGGRKDVQAALVSVETGSPVVVVKGSGRAANVIAYICENTELERYEIEAITEEHFSSEFEPNSSEMRSLVDWLMKLAEPDYQRMLNVYDAESMDPNEQLDRVILTTFLRQTSLSVVTQLNMAMAWNRPDLAAQEIFSSERKAKWEQLTGRDLEYSMLRALARNQTEFVSLLFDHGINIGTLLNLETLAGLYSSLINKPDPQMMRLREQLDYLSSPLSSWLMTESKTVGYATHNESQTAYQERLLRAVGLYVSAKSGGVLRSPYPRRDRSSYQAEDLLIWSIVVQRTDMARIIWRQTSDTIASALVSAMMLRNMKSLAESEGSLEASAQLGAAADSFEGLAAGVLATCYAQDKQKTLDTLVRRLPVWDGQTLLTLADQGECMEFMSQQAVQTKISDIWIAGSKTYLPLWRTLICMLLPMLIPALIFDKWLLTSPPAGESTGAGGDRHSSVRMKRSSVQPKTVSTRQSFDRHQQQQQQQHKQQGATPSLRKSQQQQQVSSGGHIQNPSFLQCVFMFYTSPQVKFISTVASAVVFLLLFSFVTLVTLKHPNEATEEEPQPSVLEFVLIGWMVSLIAEEIRQIFDRNKVSALEKLKDWFAHAWDVFDLVLNLMMISCILVRVFVTEEYFVWVRMTYALTLTMFYIRFMQFYLIHQTLGPKVVMVTRMINDTVFFFAILVVFLLAYGVAAQALLYPNSPLSWKLIKDVVYLPYWQMYGELQLGDILADDDKVSPDSPPIMPSNVTGRGFEGGGEGEESEAVHSPLVIVLFAFYMLITNVLLLNLLIAMFQHTFDLVQESSRKVWAYSRYQLIFEFHHRPFLCHPLTVLCHIANVLERLWRAACGRKAPTRDAFMVDYDSRTQRMLGAFVQQGTDKYLTARRSEYAQPDDEEDNWLLALERLDDVKYQVEHLESRLTASSRRKLTGIALQLESRSNTRLQLQKRQPDGPEAAEAEAEPAGPSIGDLSSRLQGVEAKLADIMQAVESLSSSLSSRRRGGSRKSKRKTRRSRADEREEGEEAEAARTSSTEAASAAVPFADKPEASPDGDSK
ncbi:hypothetical protein BOX15_Mlig018997g1 [Macrostomum lignano]|uniref:Ion_trans domain-containing protein n=4 Tax=Macrostomum lignano TaxID=282301 RepID=A0A267EIK9_9PLAT|nr:hypothetical protein BOX15_Mlig018997g1 [Macrostomum lignano]